MDRRSNPSRFVFGSFLAVCLAHASLAADPALRPDGLILNEVLSLQPGASATWPLYLTRRGDYYVEVVREHGDGSRGTSLPARALTLELLIADGERTLVQRSIDTRLDPERPLATLLWFTSDREVPLKRSVDFTLAFTGSAVASDEQLRVQVKRKPLMRPPPR